MIMLMPEATDFDIDFEIVSAQPGFISSCQYVDWYDHPRAHRNSDTSCTNILVDRSSALTEAELFKKDSGWESTVNRYISDAAGPGDNQTQNPLPKAESTGIPAQLKMTAEELKFFIDTGEDYGNPGRWGFEVDIPWRALKPYLRADLPIKLNTE